jgi:hypothetical protein
MEVMSDQRDWFPADKESIPKRREAGSPIDTTSGGKGGEVISIEGMITDSLISSLTLLMK